MNVSVRRSTSEARPGIEFWATVGILSAYILWILSLPCFPSTDGPVHMYYVHVLGALLSHTDARYEYYFHIRHILPPYSVYYYVLLLLSQAVPMPAADRVVICLYLVSFVFGFRYLASAIGPRADLATLLATLLVLNWPLGMGFLSFCLSLSLAFWALGIWLRCCGTGRTSLRLGFVALCSVVMLTHPVPLLLVLATTGVLLAVTLLRPLWSSGRFSWPEHAWADLLTWTGAAINLCYLRLFATAHPLSQGDMPMGKRAWLMDLLYRCGFYGREHALSFVYGRGADLLTYRWALLAILVLPLVATAWQTRRSVRQQVWRPAETFFVLGCAFMVLIPVIPSRLNDCFYFADRLLICVWIAFLLALSGWTGWAQHREGDPPRDWQRRNVLSRISALVPRVLAPACVVCMVVTTAALLHGADRLLRPAAQSVAHLEQMRGYPLDGMGFVIEDARQPIGSQHENVSWNPYYWALVNVFRNNDAVLANAPWMDESIIPVAPSAPLPEMSIMALQQPVPSLLQKDLLRSRQDFDRTFASVQFFISNDFDRPLRERQPLVERSAESVKDWNCSARGWYSLCYAPQRQGLGPKGGEADPNPRSGTCPTGKNKLVRERSHEPSPVS